MKQPGGKAILVQGRPKNTSVDWINDQIKDLIQAGQTILVPETSGLRCGLAPSELGLGIVVDRLNCPSQALLHQKADNGQSCFREAQRRSNLRWFNIDALRATTKLLCHALASATF